MSGVTLEHVHQSNLIENIDNSDADRDYLEVCDWLMEEPKITHGIICSVQREITAHQDIPLDWKGYYRSVNNISVSVGGRLCPRPTEVDGLMLSWVDKYSEGAEDPWTAHIEFESIHPFADGNGRTGRALLWWHFMKNGQEPSVVWNSSKFNEYYPIFDTVSKFAPSKYWDLFTANPDRTKLD